MLHDNIWESKTVPIDSLKLDTENPRIPMQMASHIPSEPEMERYLLQSYGVIPLAKSIVKYEGLYPHERLVCVEEDGKYVVLEGNRRLTACRFLLGKTAIPDGIQILKLSESCSRNIQNISICISHDRKSGMDLVAKLHIEEQKKGWDLRQKIIFVGRYYGEKMSLDDISSSLDLQPEQVLELYYKKKVIDRTLIEVAQSAELTNAIWDPAIDLAPYCKVALSRETEKFFGRSLFHSNGDFNTEWHFKIFRQLICSIVEDSLLSQINPTDFRYKDQSIVSYLSDRFPGLKNNIDIRDKESETVDMFRLPELEDTLSGSPINSISSIVPPTEQNPSSSPGDQVNNDLINNDPRLYVRVPIFFEGINNKRKDDQRLQQLSKELRFMSRSDGNKCNYEKYPLGASFLMRAILEQCLYYHIWRYNKSSGIIKKRYGFWQLAEFIVNQKENMCIKNDIFLAIERLIHDSSLKEDLDWNVHNAAGNSSAERLRVISGQIQPIIHYILCEHQYPE